MAINSERPNTHSELRAEEAGFALLVVLGFLLLFSAFLIPFASSARLTALVADNNYQDVRLAYAADAISAFVAARLAIDKTASSGVHQPAKSSSLHCALGRMVVDIQIQDHSGLIDLNAAGPELLQLGFNAAGLDQSAADEASKAVSYYRQTGTTGNTEPAMPIGPEGYKHAPFEDVAELQEFPALRQFSVARLMRIFTVNAKSSVLSEATLAPLIKTAIGRQTSDAQALIVPSVPGSDVVTVEAGIQNGSASSHNGSIYRIAARSGDMRRLLKFPTDTIFPQSTNTSSSADCFRIFDARALVLFNEVL